MRAISFTKARNSLKSLLDQVVNDADCAAITHRDSQDKKTLKRINKLIDNTIHTPFDGIGKPERLKENLSGYAFPRGAWERGMGTRICFQVSP